MIEDLNNGLTCPIPISKHKNILLAHGGGGRLSQELIQNIFLSQYNNNFLNVLHDGAMFNLNSGWFAFSTDSYVINPIFFPGGNIGSLSINGTVNDLAMCGAKPLYLSTSFILEEGLSMDDLHKIAISVKDAANNAGVQIVTGDTKVVNKGKADKIFINTSGIGIIPNDVNIHPQNIKIGDKIILSGNIAEHGIAIISARNELEFETSIQSDCAPLNNLVDTILATSKNINMMRDPTRGGVASSLNEIAQSANIGIDIFEDSIPILEEVKAACEILGFDPLYVANEGKLIAFVSQDSAEIVLDAMKNHPLGKNAAIIGSVVDNHKSTVVLKTKIGGERIVDMLSGEQLPRIC